LCEDRGLQCGADDKILGPKTKVGILDGGVETHCPRLRITSISQLSPLLEGGALTGRDLKYLEPFSKSYKSLNAVLRSVYPQRSANAGAGAIERYWEVSLHLPQFPLSSKPFRYASLALAASQTDNTNSETDMLLYLGEFYRHIQGAIRASSHVEVLMSSYVILLREYALTTPSQEAFFVFFGGFCRSVKALLSVDSSHSKIEPPSVRDLCYDSLHMLTIMYWSGVRHDGNLRSKDPQGLEKVIAALDDILPALFFDTRVRTAPLVEGRRIIALARCLNLYFDRYLGLKMQLGSSHQTPYALHSVTQTLRRILCEIIHLVPQIPAARTLINRINDAHHPLPWNLSSTSALLERVDGHHKSSDPEVVNAVLLYGIANITLNLLLALQPPDPIQVILDATFICRLNDLPTESYAWSPPIHVVLRVQSLFLAGVILTKSISVQGLCPINLLLMI
jgi:hypothetical protein